MKTNTKLIPLIVTTIHRGVFFGYGSPELKETIRLERAQMCVSWTSDIHGIVGLASTGPTKSCRVGPVAPAITLAGITSIMEVSKVAEEAWLRQPWN